jgi:hypothetical protein
MGTRLHFLDNLHQVHASHVVKQVNRELGNVVAVLERNL